MYPHQLRCGAHINMSCASLPCLLSRAWRRLAVLTTGLVLAGFCLLPGQLYASDLAAPAADAGWTCMPAASRATYIGIHGGTVPVSLLTSPDGTHMVALVGRTGNDFLRALKVQDLAARSEPPAGLQNDAETRELLATADELLLYPPRPLAANATVLMAGTALGEVPVIYATGQSFARMGNFAENFLPFGLSNHSPLFEGAVKEPLKAEKKTKAVKRGSLVRARSGSSVN